MQKQRAISLGATIVASLVSIIIGIDILIHPTDILGFPSAIFLIIAIPTVLVGGFFALPASYVWKKRISWIMVISLSLGSAAVGLYAILSSITWPTIVAGLFFLLALPGFMIIGLAIFRAKEARAASSANAKEKGN